MAAIAAILGERSQGQGDPSGDGARRRHPPAQVASRRTAPPQLSATGTVC